jgi:membrane protein DedA with SNARE-associated domain
VGWAIGRRGGRPLLERHGRWMHLDADNLLRAEAWFDRHGDRAVFLGRLTPVVRSFTSIPAGIFETAPARYTGLTLAGSAIWCFGFAAVGWALGDSYDKVHHAFTGLEVVLVVGAMGAVVALLVRRRRRQPPRAGAGGRPPSARRR